MHIVRKLVVFMIAALIAAPSSLSAEGRQVADTATLAAAVGEHVARQDADRAAVREALARPQVREIADHLGLDVTRAAAVVNTLDGADLTRAADAARQVNQRFVGGATTIVITTTTIIIALLLILILVLAID